MREAPRAGAWYRAFPQHAVTQGKRGSVAQKVHISEFCSRSSLAPDAVLRAPTCIHISLSRVLPLQVPDVRAHEAAGAQPSCTLLRHSRFDARPQDRARPGTCGASTLAGNTWHQQDAITDSATRHRRETPSVTRCCDAVALVVAKTVSGIRFTEASSTAQRLVPLNSPFRSSCPGHSSLA